MIDTVIMGTKTIAEYKAVRADMQERAERYARQHIAGSEQWTHGLPVKCWRNSDGGLSIQYEDGMYWHYSDVSGRLQWW